MRMSHVPRRQGSPKRTSRPSPYGERGQIGMGTVILVIGAVIVVFPFVWMILGSFKTLTESNAFPPRLFPKEWDFLNFKEAWLAPPGTLAKYFQNTIIVALVGTVLQVILCALAAYAFALMRFPGRDVLFALVLATMMVPGEISLIPNFVTIRHFPLVGGNNLMGVGGIGLYNTYAAMIIPGLIGAFNVFLLRQAFLQIPRDLWEAAQIDGSTSFRYLLQVIVPLSRASLLTVFLFGLIGRWNGLLWPLIVTRDETLRPIQLAMIWYQGEFSTDYGVVMAASIMATIPIVVLFLFTQKQFIEGIAGTGLKG